MAELSDSVREYLRLIGRKGAAACVGTLASQKRARKAAKARWRKVRLAKAMEKLCPKNPPNP